MMRCMDGAVRTVLERAVFSAAGATFTWADALASAAVRDTWDELTRAASDGLACELRLAAGEEPLAPQLVVDETTAFRYAHNLIAGDDLTEWLARWALTATEWRDQIKRSLLRKRWAADLTEIAGVFPPGDDEVGAALWPEAVCSGLLVNVCLRLAGDVALACETLAGIDQKPFIRIHTEAALLRAAAVTEAGLEREVAARQLEWLRIEGASMDLPAEDVAREALLCIRDDGRALEDVARDCGVIPARVSVLMADVDETLAPGLLAASDGELLGPLARHDGFTLMVVERKAPASLNDPEVRRRAEARLVERAVERAINKYVTWHESL